MTREASFWTAEKDAAAKALWRQGRSAREVARLVGARSQSAVLGRMWRLGVKRPTKVAELNHQAATGARRMIGQSERHRRWEKASGRVLPARFAGPAMGPVLAEQPLPQQTPVLCSPRPWLTREDWECAYPVAGEGVSTLSCCNTPARRGYCAAHRAVMVRWPLGPLSRGADVRVGGRG
ncbi:MAG TPA: GcrA family cell cycle regulator [Caulobacteraceae bacterium]